MPVKPDRLFAHRIGTAGLLAGLVAALLGAAVGGLLLTTRYVAEARLIVGEQTVAAQAVPGYAVATEQLAANYSRLLEGDVVTDAARASSKAGSGLSLTASPIPGSAVIRIEAESKSKSASLSAADAASDKLVTLVADNGKVGSGVTTSLAAYLAASRDLANAQASRLALESSSASSLVTATARGAYQAAVADEAAATLRRDALGQQYQAEVRADESNSSSLQSLQQAIISTSNRRTHVILGAFAGLVLLLLLVGVLKLSRRPSATA